MAQREIKFRAWDKEDKYYAEISRLEYEDGQLDTVTIVANVHDNSIVSFGYDPEMFVLEQYTGIKDYTGAEIYEGDILIDEDSIILGDVNMREGSWDVGDYTLSDIQVTVIGNIHENPELLEAE